MARPVTITNEQILDAAREVFLEKGIRATTAEVARRAGIAEGSIFNRFKTKEELFSESMRLLEPAWVTALSKKAEREDVREALLEIGEEIAAFFRTIIPLMMMAWSNAGTGMPPHLRGDNPPPVRALKGIAAFFEAHMRAGRIRRHDPEILARVFLGSLQAYCFFEILLGSSGGGLPLKTYLKGQVNLLWRGLAPSEEARTVKKPRSRATPERASRHTKRKRVR
jgi:AcrR family transcriptional regulator